jgi:hypothetical protein
MCWKLPQIEQSRKTLGDPFPPSNAFQKIVAPNGRNYREQFPNSNV